MRQHTQPPLSPPPREEVHPTHAWEQNESRAIIEKVHERQAQQLFYQAWVHNLGSVLVAICSTLAVWRAVDHHHLLLWLALFIAIYSCRCLIAWQFHRTWPTGDCVGKWVGLQFGAIIASALAYGVPSVFLWPDGYPLEQMAWVITITAITAAAVARYSVWKYAELPFIVFALLPVTLRLFLHGGVTYIILGILGVIYSLVLLQIGRVMHKANLENLLMGVKNQQLNEHLALEIAKVTELNKQLRHEMAERERALTIIGQQQGELEQARRMEALGLLSAGVAHEMNTPLHFIRTNLEFIGDGLQSMQNFAETVFTLACPREAKPLEAETLCQQISLVREESDIDYFLEEMGQAKAEVDQGVNRVSTIVHALKLHVGSENAGVSAVDIKESIENAILLTHSLAKDVCTINTHYQQEMPLITCRAQDINQVIMNLLINSVQAIIDNKAQTSGKGLIEITTQATDNLLKISIRDNGIGIPEEIGKRIFDDFYTTREGTQGMGHGLSFAYRVMTQHGGTISFESVAHEGSTFYLTLPASAPLDQE